MQDSLCHHESSISAADVLCEVPEYIAHPHATLTLTIAPASTSKPSRMLKRRFMASSYHCPSGGRGLQGAAWGGAPCTGSSWPALGQYVAALGAGWALPNRIRTRRAQAAPDPPPAANPERRCEQHPKNR